MAGKSPSNQSESSFWFFEAKKATEVIEARDGIMYVEVIKATEVFKTCYILEITKIMTRITLFWCFEKRIFLNRMMEYQVKFCHRSGLRLWRTGMLFLTKSNGHKSNVRISSMYRYRYYKLKVHISIRQTQITFVSSLWDKLYCTIQ